MIDDYETCMLYNERIFNRNGHTFRLMAIKDHGQTWISDLQIKTPYEAHLYAMQLMDETVLQIWIFDETSDDVILPLSDVWDRYEAIKKRKMEAEQ